MVVKALKYLSWYDDYREYIKQNPNERGFVGMSKILLGDTLTFVVLMGLASILITYLISKYAEVDFVFSLYLVVFPIVTTVLFVIKQIMTLIVELILILIKKYSK